MRKVFVTVLSLGLLLSISLGSDNVNAATKTYKNCTELNKDYKGGVAKASNVKNKGGKTKYKPYISKVLYDANKSKDRDKDFIACEQ
jgi:hypothetical protein